MVDPKTCRHSAKLLAEQQSRPTTALMLLMELFVRSKIRRRKPGTRTKSEITCREIPTSEERRL